MWSPSVWTFAAALAVSGAAIGVGMTAAYTAGGALLPADAHATGFGADDDRVAHRPGRQPDRRRLHQRTGLRIVFEADIVLMVALAAAVWAWMAPGISPPRTAAPDVSAS